MAEPQQPNADPSPEPQAAASSDRAVRPLRLTVRKPAACGKTDQPPVIEALEFTIPTVPLRANQMHGQHWALRKHETTRLKDYVFVYGPRGTAPFPYPAIVTLTFYTKNGRGDPDSMQKCLLDALQPNVLRTDSPKWIHQLRTQVRKGTARTEIRIERAPVDPE
jgi:hypothetical protein